MVGVLLMAAWILGRLAFNQGFIPDPFQEPEAVVAIHPEVQAKAQQVKDAAAKLGIDVVLTNGFRSTEEQNVLYEQGRSTEGPVVTKAKGGDSYHNYGLAIDFALRTGGGDVVWDLERDDNGNGKADWMEVVTIAKKLGFTWGGDWVNFPDYPHLQMDFGYSIRQLKNGRYPEGSITAPVMASASPEASTP